MRMRNKTDTDIQKERWKMGHLLGSLQFSRACFHIFLKLDAKLLFLRVCETPLGLNGMLPSFSYIISSQEILHCALD